MRMLFRILLLLSLLSSWASFAGQNDNQDASSTFKGADAVVPWSSSLKGADATALWITGLDQHTQALGLNEGAIRDVIQPVLEQLGIRILPTEESHKNETIPVFVVMLNVIRNTVDTSYSFSFEFRQQVRLVRDSKISVRVPTWMNSSMGMSNNAIAASEILKYMRNGMLDFRQEYLWANVRP